MIKGFYSSELGIINVGENTKLQSIATFYT